ncbi:hypothetical protein [Brevundimonas sp.]|uniref:hypothetical protein n=1 Tax=Brevundimonas sp. TaxID=1871086 RepID=UPI00289C6103|nr:hypothetical protein [Brevundimonas sp.]
MAYTFSATDLIDLRRFCGFPFDLGAPLRECDYAGKLFAAVSTSLNDDQGAYVVTLIERCRDLESDVYAVRELMQVAGAEGFQRDTDELNKRIYLYTQGRFQLVTEMGIAPGPALAGLAQTRIRRLVS